MSDSALPDASFVGMALFAASQEKAKRGRRRKYSAHPTLLGSKPANKEWGLVDGRLQLVSKPAGRRPGVAQRYSDDNVKWLADRVRAAQRKANKDGSAISVREAIRRDALDYFRGRGDYADRPQRSRAAAHATKAALRLDKMLRRRAPDLFGV